MKTEKRNRALLLVLAGGYILYLAYSLLRDLLAGADGMPRIVFIGAIVLFAVSGIAILWFAWKIYRSRNEEDPEKDDGNDSAGGLK